ncbi:GST [Lepeophtheirus salmonis]|uniref:GST n=1 Tax=Lepeophtheirus salmonis TaxID=72036 RepID=A0A7R8H4F4_LEPSM|nr:GST [Lepeophtheirus salmonis]CAF2846496.1 GST [Lepeophtheirus salmonis]
MPLKIYGMTASPPVRLVLLTAEVLGLDYEFVEVNIDKSEQLADDFLKLNPQHNIPVLQHDDFIMNESRAIAGYLVRTFDPNGNLYPIEPKIQARVDQRLLFDMGITSRAIEDIIIPILFGRKLNKNDEVKKKELDKLKEAMNWMREMIQETGYAADTKMVDTEEYEELEKYFKRLSELIPNYEKANGEGSKLLGDHYIKMLSLDEAHSKHSSNK